MAVRAEWNVWESPRTHDGWLMAGARCPALMGAARRAIFLLSPVKIPTIALRCVAWWPVALEPSSLHSPSPVHSPVPGDDGGAPALLGLGRCAVGGGWAVGLCRHAAAIALTHACVTRECGCHCHCHGGKVRSLIPPRPLIQKASFYCNRRPGEGVCMVRSQPLATPCIALHVAWLPQRD